MWSYRLKQLCFFFIMSATAGLLYYFLRHRWFCEPGGEWVCFHLTSQDSFNHSFPNIVISNANYEFCLVDFYCAMHFSAKRGNAIACRLSLSPSICLSVCKVGGLWSHRLEFFQKIISPLVSLGCSLFATQHDRSAPREHP